jgi:antitoxin component of MazEF toxin-antitoxin module
MGSYIKKQKVIKVGNSLAVTLDKEFAKQTGLQVGDSVASAYSVDKGVVSMAKSKKGVSKKTSSNTEREAYVSSKITPELKDWTEKFISDYQEALEKLANL